MSALDRWRALAAALAALSLVLALTLRGAVLRARVAESRTAHAIFDCYTSPEDRDHQGLDR